MFYFCEHIDFLKEQTEISHLFSDLMITDA